MRVRATFALLLGAASLATAAGAREARIFVGTDARLELLGIVESLTGSSWTAGGFIRPDIDYARTANRRFAPFSSHAAVRESARLDRGEIRYRARAELLLKMSAPPELAWTSSPAEDKSGVVDWLEAMRAFSREAKFLEFYRQQQEPLESLIRPLRLQIEAADFEGKLERYTGMPFKGRFDFLVALFRQNRHQINELTHLDDGSTRIVSVVAPDEIIGGRLVFGLQGLEETAWHELSHGTIDGLADLHREEIAKTQDSYKRLPWKCYNDWRQCVKEHMVRAVMIRLIALEHGEAAGEKQLQEEGEDKYPYLREMLKRLREYEKERKKYRTIADFYPVLLGAFSPDGGDGAARSGEMKP